MAMEKQDVLDQVNEFLKNNNLNKTAEDFIGEVRAAREAYKHRSGVSEASMRAMEDLLCESNPIMQTVFDYIRENDKQ